MTYSVKQAEQTVPQNETKNPPDAKPADWRSPWKGAAIGGTLGGLITTALGYLYGHRGRWLAYDAIAGGGTGAAVGYGVDAHNNAKAETTYRTVNKYSQKGREFQRQQDRLSEQDAWNKKVSEKKDIDQQGGLGNFWDNTEKFGFTKAFMNWRKANEFRTNHVDEETFDEAKRKMDADRRRQKARQMAATFFH